MTEWILYGIRPNMSISNAIADNAIVLLNAGFICKEDAMVYWQQREHAGCHHLFLAPNNRTNKGNVSASISGSFLSLSDHTYHFIHSPTPQT